MFFVLPMTSIFWIYLLAAVVPAVILMKFIYDQDTVEHEPLSLLFRLLLGGVLAALVSIVLETIGEGILDTFLSQDSPNYSIISAFLVVAVVEEGSKFFFLKRRTWKDPNFNYRFDGIVYAAFVSLGFAAFENIGYVFGYGLSVSISRAFLSIPGHLGFSVFMGAHYGRAKLCADEGDEAGKKKNLFLAWFLPVLLHGFYDSCAMIGTGIATLLFIVFVIVMYIIVFRKIKHESHTDEPV